MSGIWKRYLQEEPIAAVVALIALGGSTAAQIVALAGWPVGLVLLAAVAFGVLAPHGGRGVRTMPAVLAVVVVISRVIGRKG